MSVGFALEYTHTRNLQKLYWSLVHQLSDCERGAPPCSFNKLLSIKTSTPHGPALLALVPPTICGYLGRASHAKDMCFILFCNHMIPELYMGPYQFDEELVNHLWYLWFFGPPHHDVDRYFPPNKGLILTHSCRIWWYPPVFCYTSRTDSSLAGWVQWFIYDLYIFIYDLYDFLIKKHDHFP